MFPTFARFFHCIAYAAALLLVAPLLAGLHVDAQSPDSNFARGKPVSVELSNTADSAPGAWISASDITDGRLDYQPASSMAEDGVVGFLNNDYNEPMTVTITIDLGSSYNISLIRYNMGNVQFANSWGADVMSSPFGSTAVPPGGSYSGAWTTQTGHVNTSTVTVQLTKTRRTLYDDWLFIGEIEVYDTSGKVVDLPVPHQSQFDTGCPKPGNFCCGVAAVNMATAFVNNVAPISAYLQKMYEYLGLDYCCVSGSNKGTNVYDQEKIAKEIGEAMNSQALCMSYDLLKDELDLGHPVVVGVRYKLLTNRCGNFDNIGHAVTLSGYDEINGTWLINDPFCRSNEGPARQHVPSSEFREATTHAFGAIFYCSQYPDTPVLGVVIRK